MAILNKRAGKQDREGDDAVSKHHHENKVRSRFRNHTQSSTNYQNPSQVGFGKLGQVPISKSNIDKQ
ncbi:hypothetical protein ES703_70210 [subsurface metagenome]